MAGMDVARCQEWTHDPSCRSCPRSFRCLSSSARPRLALRVGDPADAASNDNQETDKIRRWQHQVDTHLRRIAGIDNPGRLPVPGDPDAIARDDPVGLPGQAVS